MTVDPKQSVGDFKNSLQRIYKTSGKTKLAYKGRELDDADQISKFVTE